MITIILRLFFREIFLTWFQSRVSIEFCSVRVENKTIFTRLTDANKIIGKRLCVVEVENWKIQSRPIYWHDSHGSQRIADIFKDIVYSILKMSPIIDSRLKTLELWMELTKNSIGTVKNNDFISLIFFGDICILGSKPSNLRFLKIHFTIPIVQEHISK